MDEVELRYGGQSLPLRKSTELVGIAAPRGSEERIRELASGHGARPTGRRRGRFQLLEAGGRQAMEERLDGLRAAVRAWQGSHVFHVHGSDEPLVPTGELFLTFAKGAHRTKIQMLLRSFALQIGEARSRDTMIVRITPASPNPIKVAAALQASGLFAVAEPDLVSAIEFAAIPVDPLMSRQWHLRNTGSINGNPVGLLAGADAKIVDAWSRAGTIGSPAVAVAVIDDGFDLGHPDLIGTGKIRAPWDSATGSNDPRPVSRQPGDAGDWHGTACAALAVGTSNGSGIVGTAPDAGLMPIRLDEHGVSDRVAERCFQHAQANGAAVVSCSFGPRSSYYPLSSWQRQAIAQCARNGRGGLGTVIVFAAGNRNQDVNDPGQGLLNGWAAHPDILAVAGTTSKDTRYLDSNFGGDIALCAPAGGSPGHGIITADARDYYAGPGQPFGGYGTGDFYSDFVGTSAAAPIVAGICALMISVRGSLTAEKIKDVLKKSADRIGAPSAYDANKHSKYYGFGRVNADKAITEILAM